VALLSLGVPASELDATASSNQSAKHVLNTNSVNTTSEIVTTCVTATCNKCPAKRLLLLPTKVKAWHEV
jgi:hypothetical protein